MPSEIATLAKAADSPAGNTLLKILGSALPDALIEPFRERIVARDIRNKIDAVVGDEIAKRIAADPAIVDEAYSRLIGRACKAQLNTEAVAQSAIEHGLLETPSGQLPEDDWVNHFTPYAEKASSDRMRDLLGRILAGEVKRPGAYSLATLRVINEISQSDADAFLWYWSHSIGDAVPTTIASGPGREFSRILQLRDVGLVSSVDSATWQSRDSSGMPIPWIIGPSHIFLIVWLKSSGHFVNVYRPTRVGAELSTLLDVPDYETNLRALAARFMDGQSSKIELHRLGMNPEIICQE